MEDTIMSTSRILPQLPLEIITEILSRLPVKPLLRFKSVCKSWFSLISNNPHFAKTHLRYANRYRLFLTTYPFQSMDLDAYCNDHNAVPRELRHPAMENAQEFELIGSCDGLVAAALDSDHSHIIVWNPTTGDSKELPVSDSPISGEIFSGFGYDSNLDDYKLVRGVASTSGSEVRIEAFSLKSDKWRSIQDLNSDISLNGTPISTNGHLHWLVPVENDPNRKLGILSFDMAEEKFREVVPIPEEVSKSLGSDSRIQKVGDEVYVCTHWYAECREGWMMVMKREKWEMLWTKRYSFSSDLLRGCEYYIEEIWVAENGNVVFDIDGRELLLYNSQEQSISKRDLDWDGFESVAYLETLVSPNSA